MHPGDFWDQLGPGAVGVGWDGALMGLALHVETGAPVDRDAFLEWDATDDGGKAFHTAASEGWGAAAVAGGDDPETARRRAATTVAFYRDEMPEPDAGA